ADSVFGSLTAVGGGGGGGGGANSQIGNPGSAGGSGGGGGRCWVSCNTSLVTSNGNKHLGGSATAGQGNNGGDAPFMSGGGGGGAAAAGSVSTGGAAGAGGDGLTIDISGSAASYAGGGGGGTENTASRAAGGLGGGGLGGSTADPVGADGTPGTGGGGGGARWTGSNGGSGVVIIRWGSAPAAPVISLSSASGYGIVNSSVGTLYTVSNSGGSVTSYSINPSLPAGLSFSSVTGLISGTPTATSAAANYTITATRVDAGNGASSSHSAVFNFGVYNTAPTTTTTSTTSTTTSTVAPQVTTRVAASQSTVAPVASTPVVAPAGSSAPPVATVTTLPARGATATTVAPATTTSTTVAPTTTTTVPAPDAPEAAPGEAGATVDGEEIDVDVERSDNALVVSAADVTATVYGIDTAGGRVALDADGNLRLEQGDSVAVEASGYEPGSDVEIWLRSTPVQLGVRTADSSGAVTGRFAVPSSVDAGDHRVILSGLTAAGGKSVIGVGLRIGAYGKESGLNKWLIILPLVLATMLALVIPTTARRRKRANG
ncbi:MAG: glycine-rich domain-containing protein, partial [Actinomycetota bacterium]